MPDPFQSSFDAPPPTDDAAESLLYVQRAKQGDTQAVNGFLLRYRERLLRSVRVRLAEYPRVQARCEPEDVVQETLHVAMRKLADFEYRGKGSVMGWLRRIALHQISDLVDRYASKKRDAAREVPLDARPAGADGTAVAFQLPADDTSPDGRVSRQELIALVDAAVAQLGADQRAVILLRDYEGESWDAIAEELGRSVRAAQELHSRAKVRLARGLRPRLRGE